MDGLFSFPSQRALAIVLVHGINKKAEDSLSSSLVELVLKEVRFSENEGIAGDEELVHDCKKVVHKHVHTRRRADWHRWVVINHPIVISSE
jgi:hypothetical protein